MLTVTKDKILPTTITGSYPKPSWYNQGLYGRAFKSAMGDISFREQYLDCVASIISDQETAGLDIVTDGDSRFDLSVGGKSWFFYPLERLNGLEGHRDTSPGWAGRGIKPGHILWEVQEAYQPPVVKNKLSRGRLEYPDIWRAAQRMTDRPVKFGAICAQPMSHMMWNEFYDSDDDLLMDLCDIMNEEYKNVVDAGCPLIQIEEPLIHSVALSGGGAGERLEFLVEAFNREVRDLDAEIWVHTCWGNPSQQRMGWDPPSYENSLSYLLKLEADVLTLECASSDGRDLPFLANLETDKKIAIGVVSHTNTVVEPASIVADRVRRALKHVPPERLILSTDCGFGREGLSRRIAFYKTVALVQGVNIVRKELGLPEAQIRAEDPRFAFGQLSGEEPASSLLPWQETDQ